MQNNQVTTADQFIEAVFSGLVLSDDRHTEDVAALLDKFKLRWTVSKTPLHLPDGKPTGFYGIVSNYCFGFFKIFCWRIKKK